MLFSYDGYCAPAWRYLNAARSSAAFSWHRNIDPYQGAFFILLY
jgi:hypothetical protein